MKYFNGEQNLEERNREDIIYGKNSYIYNCTIFCMKMCYVYNKLDLISREGDIFVYTRYTMDYDAKLFH